MNPVFPNDTNAAAVARANQLVEAVGLRHLSPADTDQGDPNFYAKFTTILQRTWEILGALAMGTAVQLVTGLEVEVFAQSYRIGATDKRFEGDAITLTANATNYLYLDADEVIKASTSAWPADVYRVAKIVCDATKVTSIEDARWMNFGVGAANSWYTVAAAGAVDFDGQALNDVGPLVLNDPSTLVIASGVITPTGPYHIVRSETVSVADDLVTITADAGKIGQLLLLRIASDSGTVTLKSTGNLALWPSETDIVLADAEQHVLLIQNSATTWVTVARPDVVLAVLAATLDANEQRIADVGGLGFAAHAVTISGDEIATGGKTLLAVSTEAAAALDDLDTITGGTDGDVIVLRIPTPGTKQVRCLHSAGSDGLRLAHAREFLIADMLSTLVLRYSSEADGWVEVARSPMTLDDVGDTTYGIPQDLAIYVPGTPATGAYKQRIVTAWDGIIQYAHGYAGTAPSGGPLICDVRVNGNSIFGAQSEMVNMASGTQQDDSFLRNYFISALDIIDIEFEAVNGAADITITLHMLRKAQLNP